MVQKGLGLFLPKQMAVIIILATSPGIHCSPPPRIDPMMLSDLPPPSSLADAVRGLIRPDCGSCHTASLSTAKVAALKVFDLDKEAWSESMTVEQLESFGRRLRGNKNDTLRLRAAAFVAEQIEQRKHKSHPDNRDPQND